jgi:hypothetical protein
MHRNIGQAVENCCLDFLGKNSLPAEHAERLRLVTITTSFDNHELAGSAWLRSL